MIGFAKKKSISISGAASDSGRSQRGGGVLGLNMNDVAMGERRGSLSSLSSRSGMNSARGHRPEGLMQGLAKAAEAGGVSRTDADLRLAPGTLDMGAGEKVDYFRGIKALN